MEAMRLLCALLFVLFLSGLKAVEGGKEGAREQQMGRKLRNRDVPSSGELTSRDNHRCTWETTAGEAQATTLQVTCSHGEATYGCRYLGQPNLCPSYAARSSQYWKQVVGKLKKKKGVVCDGERVLKTRVCKKGPAESHMRLVEEQRGEEEKKNAKREDMKNRLKGGGVQLQGARDGSEEKSPGEQDGGAFGEVNDGNMETEHVLSYCAEDWQSFCSFLVKFIEG